MQQRQGLFLAQVYVPEQTLADGVVTLTGTVRTAAEKKKAIAIAKDTDGVKSVVDRLKVGK